LLTANPRLINFHLPARSFTRGEDDEIGSQVQIENFAG
jgi:hypothetical protein